MGAWDSENFAFRVFGEKLSKKLKVFFDSMKSGDAMFAGALSKTPEFYKANASGVMIALKSKFRPEHKEALKIADEELVSDVYLKTLSETEEILNLSYKKRVQLGFVWPDWKDGAGSEVVYKINPSHEYSGLIRHAHPYTKESIMEWINSDKKLPMKLSSERSSKMKI